MAFDPRSFDPMSVNHENELNDAYRLIDRQKDRQTDIQKDG